MVLCNVECLERISNYLDVSPLQLEMQENAIVTTESNQKIEGFSTIVQSLIENSKCSDMLGTDNETKALTRQWLEYAVVCVNYADTPANIRRILQRELTHQEKAQYVHVSRWFDNMQQEEKLRQQLDLISFDLLHLFL
ncbi:aaRS-interacting multifunctional protein 3 isoform X2 [Megachile rotundata]|uniref:aaRS-interacting multifunctional protein 3 isoform X2 n=1 Tax=Megachile rotundata TaxID=143995 RepID=UPI0006150A07|nr:PREDICTED: uncharacterized protein LOC100876144 isoform X2 [Megachile rotundata]